MIGVLVYDWGMITSQLGLYNSISQLLWTLLPTHVDFSEGQKFEYLEENPQSTREINYRNLTHSNGEKQIH